MTTRVRNQQKEREYKQRRYHERRNYALNALGAKCSNCWERDGRLLEFHHKDPSKKKLEINRAWCYSWAKFKAELKKLVILCHACHVEEHRRLRRDQGLPVMDDSCYVDDEEYDELLAARR